MADHNDAPTVTEFVPADEVPANRTDEPMLIKHQYDGGLEIAAHEPYGDVVHERTYVCDRCGHEETSKRPMRDHVEQEH